MSEGIGPRRRNEDWKRYGKRTFQRQQNRS